jgi:hypothetical protein
MKEILKKDLIKVISEQQSEMDELAYKPKGTQDDAGRIRKFKPIFKDDNNTDIPDGWYINPNQVEGEEKAVMYLNGMALENFIQENQGLLDSILEKIGEDKLCYEDAHAVKCQPRSAKFGTKYVHSGINKPASTKIKIDLNRLIDHYLGNEEVQQKLEKLSIPEIRARDRKHLDAYKRIDNNEVNYQTHTFNSYTSSKQFLQFVTARITGKPVEDEFKSYHLARQFNQNYRNWEETKKNDKRYVGKTPGYMLDAFGFDEDNLDVTVRMDLIIRGVKSDGAFLWTIVLRTKFGRKLQEDYRLGGGLDLDKDIRIAKRAEFDPNTTFNDENTILDNLSIKSALIEALDELRDTIMKMKPIEALKLANIKQFDITKRPSVNEDVEILYNRLKRK